MRPDLNILDFVLYFHTLDFARSVSLEDLDLRNSDGSLSSGEASTEWRLAQRAPVKKGHRVRGSLTDRCEFMNSETVRLQ